jgi:DnaJ-class molecular chaperone
MAKAERSFTCKTSDVRLQHSVNHILDPMSGQRDNRDKKSCRTCTGHKIKRVPVERYNPRICTQCRDKGQVCEYEVRKEYVRKAKTLYKRWHTSLLQT